MTWGSWVMVAAALLGFAVLMTICIMDDHRRRANSKIATDEAFVRWQRLAEERSQETARRVRVDLRRVERFQRARRRVRLAGPRVSVRRAEGLPYPWLLPNEAARRARIDLALDEARAAFRRGKSR